MPAVRESSDETPEALEVVEVRPGVRLKLNAADKKAYLTTESDAAEARRRWNLVNAQVADKPAKETVIAGPATDGPIDHPEPTDADEATVTAAPKPRKK